MNIDFCDAKSWDDEMPERMRWLRENDPVHWSEATGTWIVSKYQDVAYVSKNPKLFCSGQGVRPNIPVRQGLIDEDDPRHTELRSLINKGFTPRMVGKLEEAFRKIIDETLDEVAPRGECDFVKDVAVPLPLLLIADMIGIRREDREDFHRWSDAMMAADGNYDRPEIMRKSAEAFMAYSAYVTELIEERRTQPRDDLLSILVGAQEAGILEHFDEEEPDVPGGDEEHAALANDELIMFAVLLMAAGNETTRNAMSGGMQLLIEQPEIKHQLSQDPSLIPVAVEEMLRLVTPVQSFSRTATRDTELGGRQIEKGDVVLMLYSSANLDPDQFPEPERFIVDRKSNHLAFGIGAHFCLGANLARMELRCAFEEILRRMPDMEYNAGGPVMARTALVRNCAEMKVRFTPEARG